ncbi:MAG TPA: carbon-nitrogen hydrolase family protein [Ktedonobacteraceae bacterium]|nr:carbon-nitrogen hydrolase family protein [Ktedonobacteraceae bacterium]
MPYRTSVNVAVAQAGSIIMDCDACTQKACELILEAGTHGAQLLVFPEAFLSGYPRGLHFQSPIGSRGPGGRQDWVRYYQSAVQIPGESMQLIAEAVREAQVYVALGIIEQDDYGSRGTLYCTTLYFGPDGRILGKHRKLKPTGTERLIWGEGDGNTLPAIQTPFGCLGGLICWENYMPLARMHLYTKGVTLYVAPTTDQRESWQATIRHIACEGRCFVLSANQYVTKQMYPTDLACYHELEDQPEVMCRGGSAIINPFGEYVAGPLYDQEGMLYATLDLQQIEQAHFDFDVTGHYSRPDVFTLLVNERPQRPKPEESD